jgi:hypothetical protein
MPLPSLLMSIAMTLAWFFVGAFGLPFAVAASFWLTISWFIFKNRVLIITIFLSCVLGLFLYLYPEETRQGLGEINELLLRVYEKTFLDNQISN